MRLIVIALCSLLAIPAPAADGPSRWDRVSKIPKTQKVKVHLRNGTVLKGAIQEATPGGLAFVEGQNVVHVDRDDIARITTKSRARGALIGGIAGFAVAGSIGAARAGYIVDKNNPNAKDRLGVLAMFGGFFGGIAAAIGLAAGSERTLYTPERAPKAEAAAVR